MGILSRRSTHILILLLMLTGILFVRVEDYGWVRSMRYLAFDTYNRLHPRPPTDQVSIVDIDEASLAKLGQWPWPRDVVAQMVDRLHAMGAKAIVFDVVFAEDDRTSPRTLLKNLPKDAANPNVVSALQSLPDHDRTLADAIKNAGNVVTGFVWTGNAESTRRDPVTHTMAVAGNAQILTRTVTPMAGMVTNIPALEQAAAGNGNFGVSTELDGLIRRVPLLFRHPGDALPILYPALSIEALRVAQGPDLTVKIRKIPSGELGLFDPPYMMQVGKYEIPFDRDGDFYVWFSKARPQSYIPAWQVIDGSLAADRIKGKIIFIGTSAEGLKDIRSTPLDLFIPGVEVHVNVTEQVLTHAYLKRPALTEGAELMAVAGVGLLIILLSRFAGAVTMAFFTLLVIAAVTFLSWTSYVSAGILLDPVFPGLSLLVLNAVSSLLAYIRAEGERKQVRSAFGLYISPDYMKELTSDPAKLQLGGTVRDLTVMFTDIRSFTTISEQMPPEALIQLMNDFLTPMSDLVMQNRGTIDKYMGDAMMAFWNAPLDDADHARHACTAGLQMNEALKPINARLKDQNLPVVLKAGIGINSGPASVGNMGSRQRFAYSALGDTVNLASRLESQTKTYGVDILVGEETWTKIPDFATLELDLIQVKGKVKPVRVFTVLGDEVMAGSHDFKIWETTHEALIACYRARDFKEAEAALAHCTRLKQARSLDAFYKLYSSRLTLMQTQVETDWNGVYTAMDK
jgi:adenylate cyclase